MNETARFALPQLAPGQMQKEFFHNEALQQIDMLLCPIVEGLPQTVPPPSPVIGSCYLVGDGANGTWSGHDGTLTCFTDGGWRFAVPAEGMHVFDRSSGQPIVWRNDVWELGILRAQQVQINDQTVLRNRQPEIGDPAGGSTADAECRAAVMSILSAMRAHGLID